MQFVNFNPWLLVVVALVVVALVLLAIPGCWWWLLAIGFLGFLVVVALVVDSWDP